MSSPIDTPYEEQDMDKLPPEAEIEAEDRFAHGEWDEEEQKVDLPEALTLDDDGFDVLHLERPDMSDNWDTKNLMEAIIWG